MRKEKGISLVALIITIIVIVLLVAIVINTAVTTPESANFAKFVSSMGELQQAVAIEYLDNYTVKVATDSTITNSQIYREMAGGEEYAGDRISEIEGASTAWKLTNELRGISSYPNAKENYYITDNGIIFYEPGYKHQGKVYITSNVVSSQGTEEEIPVDTKDITSPSEPISITTDVTTTIIIATASGSVDTGSGLAGYKYSIDNESWTSIVASGTSYTFENLTNNTAYTIYAKAIDNQENESTVKNVTITTAEDISWKDGSWDATKLVNTPKIVAGMTPVYFNDSATEVPVTSSNKNDWYDYTTASKKWANAKTQDGSYWVWIPRYEYVLNSSTKTSTVKFIPTSQTTVDSGYTDVHPAFRANVNLGGWDSELSGIWVAKFMAGYAMGGKGITGGNTVTAVESTINYEKETTPDQVLASATETGTSEGFLTARNWLDGVYGDTATKIKYPVFIGKTIAMNNINQSESFNVCKAMDDTGNVYGFNSGANTHLMKNSEWGAIAYLSKSQYGLGSTNIYINNVTLNSGNSSTTNALTGAYAVTGYVGASADANTNTVSYTTTFGATLGSTSYAWNTSNGKNGSTTGEYSGVYDMSGCLWERTAGYVANGNPNLSTYGSSFVTATSSTKYATVYPSNDSGQTNIDTASQINYAVNTVIYGDGIRETSTAGTGATGWYGDYSYFPAYSSPFFVCGGDWRFGSGTGEFTFVRCGGDSGYYSGFRAVLCP